MLLKAGEGDAEAQAELGLHGVEKSEEKAAEWLAKAAKQGHSGHDKNPGTNPRSYQAMDIKSSQTAAELNGGEFSNWVIDRICLVLQFFFKLGTFCFMVLISVLLLKLPMVFVPAVLGFILPVYAVMLLFGPSPSQEIDLCPSQKIEQRRKAEAAIARSIRANNAKKFYGQAWAAMDKRASGETSALIPALLERSDREPLSAPELRTALRNFYEVHCPEKKDGKALDAVVEGYASNKRAQTRLNQVLLQRYGTDLNGASTGLPPSTVVMEAIEVAGARKCHRSSGPSYGIAVVVGGIPVPVPGLTSALADFGEFFGDDGCDY
jgi:hypothetical protein